MVKTGGSSEPVSVFELTAAIRSTRTAGQVSIMKGCGVRRVSKAANGYADEIPDPQ